MLSDVAHSRLVGTVHVQDGEDKVVLGPDPTVREHSMNDSGDVVLVLFSQLEDSIFIPDVAQGEQALDIVVLLEQADEDLVLVSLQAIRVLVNDLLQRQERSLQNSRISRIHHVLLNELVNGLQQLLGGELGFPGTGLVHNSLELSVEPLRHTRVQCRRLSKPFTVRKFGVAENFNKLLQGGVHDDLVVETSQDVPQDAVKDKESLRRLGTGDLGRTNVGKLSCERLRMLDTRWVVKSENSQNITGFKSRTGLLNKLDDTILLRNQRHVHLHNLDFSEGLATPDVLAILNGKLDKLTWGRGAQLGRVVLLLQ